MLTDFDMPRDEPRLRIGRWLLAYAVGLVIVTVVLTALHFQRRHRAFEVLRASTHYEAHENWVLAEWLFDPVSVRIASSEFDNGELAQIAPVLQGVERLDLAHSAVTGSGLRVLPTMPRLESLWLDWVPLSAGDLDFLSASTQLTTLDLEETGIGDSGLAPLAVCPLESLDLSGTRVTDRGIETLSLATLGGLYLDETAVTDDVCRVLSRAEDLTSLDLGGTGVTDAGVAALVHLPRLDLFKVGRTAVTVEGLAEFLRRRRFTPVLDPGQIDAGKELLRSYPQLKYVGVDTRDRDLVEHYRTELPELEWFWGERHAGF